MSSGTETDLMKEAHTRFAAIIADFSNQYASQTRSALALRISLICATTICAFLVYRIYFHPLSHLPGPLLAKVSGLWRNNSYWKGTWHIDILEVHRRYGRVVRIAPDQVSIVDEYAMKSLYGHGHNAPKTRWYSIWDPPGTAPQLFSELRKPNHAFLRKRLASAYSMSSILKYEVYIQSTLNVLMEKLKNYADNGSAVDMSQWTNAFAFDVVGELGYGSDLGHLRTESDVNGLRTSILTGFTALSNLGHFPFLVKMITNPMINKISQMLGAADVFTEFREWTTSKVQDRLDNIASNKHEDMLSHFCQMKTVNGDPVSVNEICNEAMNLIGAGADTTSIGMRTCIYYLALNPAAYQRLQKEVDRFYEDEALTEPITFLQTQQIPFLIALVKESTRLLPSIVFPLPRYAPDNFVIRGKHIPAGTTVGISPLAQNHDKEIWGDDADDFRPERWLEDESRTKYFDSATMTFGGNGPRMCIGRNIALVELYKFTAQFIHNFDFKFVDNEQPWKISSHWFAYQYGLKMNLRSRR